MVKIQSLNDFKEFVQAAYSSNESTLIKYGRTEVTQLKAYLIETHCKITDELSCPVGRWRHLEGAEGWFFNDADQISPDLTGQFFLDAQHPRIWKIYTLMRVSAADSYLDMWTRKTKGIDNCWLTRHHLLQWEKQVSWESRGVGIRFDDGLNDPEEATSFSLKAWHGSSERIPGLADLISKAKEKYAIHSIRWQKRAARGISLVMEWYSNGKVTVNKADDIDEVLAVVSQMASRYAEGIEYATELRDTKLAPFELEFSQPFNLDFFKETVEQGRGNMRLWLLETEAQDGFKRFRGVDMHTWDRILLDVGSGFAYLTIPGKGCVNAAPRIAALQGIDNAGKTNILFDGDEVFV